MNSPDSPELPFVVRAYPSDTKDTPVETWHPRLGPAVDLAREMAGLPAFRSVEVLDNRNMLWARFNMLWSVSDDFA